MESAAGSSLSSLPEKFHPPKTYAFPKRKFGSKGEERSCRAAWFDKYDWLHYDATADCFLPPLHVLYVVFCMHDLRRGLHFCGFHGSFWAYSAHCATRMHDWTGMTFEPYA